MLFVDFKDSEEGERPSSSGPAGGTDGKPTDGQGVVPMIVSRPDRVPIIQPILEGRHQR
jgi:hypothetical protein